MNRQWIRNSSQRVKNLTRAAVAAGALALAASTSWGADRPAYIYTVDGSGNLGGAPVQDGRTLAPLAGNGLSNGGYSEVVNLAIWDNWFYFVDAAGNLIG